MKSEREDGLDQNAEIRFMKKDVSRHAETAEELPLVHTSRCEHVKGIIAKDALEAKMCPVFNERLVYFFYGRPSYKSERAGAGRALPLCPICFVFRPATISRRLRRVYPCDTGAIKEGLLSPSIMPEDLRNLELDNRIESAQKLVSMLYGTNHAYFRGEAVDHPVFPPSSIGEKFQTILADENFRPADDRRSAIEAQVKASVSLKDKVLFVVLPSDLYQESEVRATIRLIWKCEAIPYPTFRGDDPSVYYAVVRNEIYRRFTLGGVF